jgi:dTDP-4-amino-4,6-dideoxygalactose transaminase
LRVLRIGRGDEVITSSRAFIACASSVVMVGATPVFVDVDPESQNLTPDSIRAVLTPRTRAILAVHLAGWPCDMEAILTVAREHNLKVIEDCAQAHGARHRGRPVGSFGDAGAFSFCQDKILTTGGEGGMLTVNDTALFEAAWSFKDHGKSYDAVFRRAHPVGFRWLHESFGTNWRLTEMQSAIGRVQLKKVHDWIATRRRNAAILNDCFSKIDALRVTVPPVDVLHAYYKYYVFVRPEYLCEGWTRDRIITEVEARGVPCFSGTCSEIYLEKAFSPEMRPATRLPVAKRLGETSLMFLVHPTLSEADMRDVCAVVEDVITRASR